MTALVCADCGVALNPNPRRKGVRCRKCTARVLGASAERREKSRAAMLRHFADPMYHHAHCQRIGEGIRRALQDPERLADLRARGRRVGLMRLGASTFGPGTEPRVQAGRKRTATVMAWCPIEYRAEYRRLVSTKLVRAPEARRMVEDMIEADLRRAHTTGQLPQTARLEACAGNEATTRTIGEQA